MRTVPAHKPDPKKIRPFKDGAAFEAWLKKNHDKETEVFIRMYKKSSGIPSIDWNEAVDVSLCWGWIDGVRLRGDEESFLQRYTPRRAKSRWSQINRTRVESLSKTGRMTPHGQRHVDAAKADGRWDAAYPSPSKLEVPEELLRAVRAEPKALAAFQKLNAANRYALAYRLFHLKTGARRTARIAEFVAMLKSGKTLYPNGAVAKKPKPARPQAKAAKRGAKR
jgi:uncharacterized protein YdeI (YjbR/CyaY-like superfamily)